MAVLVLVREDQTGLRPACFAANFSVKRRMRPARARMRVGFRRMPSFSDLPGAEGFLFSSSALVSQTQPRAVNTVHGAFERSACMLKVRLSVLALAGLCVVSESRAVTVAEDFSTDPLLRGWQVFGDASLFAWNSTNGNLEVTWDSSHTNSYFYFPLGAQFTRYDDLRVEFDLQLQDIASNVEPGKTGPLQIGLGLLNFAGATSTNFMHGAYGGAPNVAEFAYYPWGYYDFGGGYLYEVVPTMTPSFISGVYSKHYAPAFLDAYEYELPTNQPVHIVLTYSALSQTALLEVRTNGTVLGPLPPLLLNVNTNSQFTDADNLRLDMFSISSYSSGGDDFDSVLAHGTVDNVTVTASLRPITRFTGAATNGAPWQAQFFTHTNWNYTLERTSDFHAWTPVSATQRGTEAVMVLQDTNTLPASAFYRMRADEP